MFYKFLFIIGHTVRTFALTTKSTRKERVIETMGVMGPAVMLGVAFTNLPGIICLHWASGQDLICDDLDYQICRHKCSQYEKISNKPKSLKYSFSE